MIIKDKTRDEIDEKYKWDLSKIYISEDEWLRDFEYVKANGDKYLEFKGKLNNADTIYEYLMFDEEFSKKADAVYMYAALKFDEDTSNSKYQELKGKIERVLTDIGAKSSYVLPELLKLSKEDFDRFMNEKSELKMYEYEFRNVQDKEGIYRIADKYFKLTYLETDYSISLKKTYMWNKLDYEINDYYVSEYEYN